MVFPGAPVAGQQITDYFQMKCPTLFTPSWYARWIAVCVREGTAECINEFVNSALFKTCRNLVLKDVERNLNEYLNGRVSFYTSGTTSLVPDCLSIPCEDTDPLKVHPREEKAANVIHSRESIGSWLKSWTTPPEWRNLQEFLRFRKDDPREKLLYVTAEFDHNGALNPRFISDILSQFSQKYDIRYTLIHTPEELCALIDRSQEAGKIAFVVIDAHGNPDGVAIGKNSRTSSSSWLNINQDYSECFSGLHPSGKIVLFSCSAGGVNDGRTKNPFDNIAQKIANDAKRVVVAAKDVVFGPRTSLLSPDTGMLFQQEHLLYSFVPFYNVNLFKLFKPHFSDCSAVKNSEIHPRDLEAVKAIHDDLSSKSLVSEMDVHNGFTEHLSFCKDDPREKVLYISADADKNGALEPKQVAGVLGVLADKFDAKFKTVSSWDEICSGVDEAASYGEIAAIFIDAHGTPNEGLLLSESSGKQNRITMSSDFNCLSKLKRDGAIVLSGGSVGQNALSENNLAQKVANVSQRIVLAPTCPLVPSSISLNSLDPLILSHPQHSFFKRWKSGCPSEENGENIFKVFHPKTSERFSWLWKFFDSLFRKVRKLEL